MHSWVFNLLNLDFYGGLLNNGGLSFTGYFNTFNSCFGIIAVIFIGGVFYTRSTSKYNQHAIIDILLSLTIVFLISLFAVFYLLEFCCITPSFLLFQQTSQFLVSYIADSVFLLLFLLITPITFVLLVRNEKLSVFFCSLNFIFLFFIVLFLISTTNIVGLVMGYELLFVPAFFIMRKTVYSSSAQSAYSVFTVWSVIGSLVVVTGVVYLLVVLGLHTTFDLTKAPLHLSEKELFVVSLLFFTGFGVKIPVWPFHYWLTRVHVEASTGFSIFLSGFLVKAAVFVCWKVIVSLGICNLNVIFTAICLFSVLDGVLKIPLQTDLKKLVAFATVFEMGLIYLFMLWKPIQSFSYIFIFCYSHAFLSGFMFFLVEVLYIRTGTRSIDMLSGLVVYFPTLSKVIWLFLFIFWGLPFTLKFFIELWVLLCFFNTGSFILLFMLLFILFFANVFVTKVWLQTIYGNPTKINFQGDLTSWELLVVAYFFIANTVSSVVFTYFSIC